MFASAISGIVQTYYLYWIMHDSTIQDKYIDSSCVSFIIVTLQVANALCSVHVKIAKKIPDNTKLYSTKMILHSFQINTT